MTPPKRYLHLKPKGHGFNNQREGVIVALMYSVMLNRTLVLPPYMSVSNHQRAAHAWEKAHNTSVHGANHSLQPTAFTSLWDVEKLRVLHPQGGVIELTDLGPRDLKKRENLFLDIRCCDVTATSVRASRAAIKTKDVEHIEISPGGTSSHPYFAQHLSTAVSAATDTFRTSFDECAAQVVRSHTRGNVVHAMHLRLGDRQPYPLIQHCETCGLQRSTQMKYAPCVHPQDNSSKSMNKSRPATFIDALTCEAALSRSPLQHGDTLFIFSNAPSDPQFISVAKKASRLGLVVQRSEDALVTASTLPSCQALDLHDLLVTSLLEQFLCVHSTGIFFSTLASSWDELVLHLRVRRQINHGISTQFVAVGQLQSFHSQMRSLPLLPYKGITQTELEVNRNCSSWPSELEGTCFPCQCKLLSAREAQLH
ncbi:hypothetical protein AB1Y20_004791 [Prymnesium parvum]|uniref:GDP-fucose protein O-fucosyltransferase 1 n=1 Tax=Prymnesium parvum TaxID=97485 RepID=A0AB34IX63_PRYPA